MRSMQYQWSHALTAEWALMTPQVIARYGQSRYHDPAVLVLQAADECFLPLRCPVKERQQPGDDGIRHEHRCPAGPDESLIEVRRYRRYDAGPPSDSHLWPAAWSAPRHRTCRVLRRFSRPLIETL